MREILSLTVIYKAAPGEKVKTKPINFETLNWHDAVLEHCDIEISSTKYATVFLTCQMYMTEEDSKRTPVQIRFGKVKTHTFILHSKELYKNAIAGNINGCYVYKNVYQFSLYGGYLEITTDKPPKAFIIKNSKSKYRKRKQNAKVY